MDHPNYFCSVAHLSYLFFSTLYSSLKKLLIVITLYKNNVYQCSIKAISLVDIACSRRSDSGLYCEVREREKIRRKRGREERLTPLPYPPPPSLFCFVFVFSAHISLHHPHDSNIASPPPPPPPPRWGALVFSKNLGMSIGA